MRVGETISDSKIGPWCTKYNGLSVPSWDDARCLCQDSSWEHLPASYCPIVIAVYISKPAFSGIPDHVHFHISTVMLFFLSIFLAPFVLFRSVVSLLLQYTWVYSTFVL